ncbi:hypothetical protein KIW84_066414 [Lathyrus oleraceus]|uniref:HORMA domain-containing protein n=1 Tax=Pisum sativum TaxID=3888 RepID=A0A9D4WHE7_PEA|nr:hypothetical protein KIW84_066414 [Pisum sativum]
MSLGANSSLNAKASSCGSGSEHAKMQYNRQLTQHASQATTTDQHSIICKDYICTCAPLNWIQQRQQKVYIRETLATSMNRGNSGGSGRTCLMKPLVDNANENIEECQKKKKLSRFGFPHVKGNQVVPVGFVVEVGIIHWILYCDEVTPTDYEPPFFRECTEEEVNHPWVKNPLKMEVGNVNSKHFVLALKVKRMPRTLLKMSNIWFGSRSGSPIVTWIPLILLMFYQIFQTVVLIEEIIDNLVKEGVLLKKGMTPMLLLIRTRNLNLNSPMRKKKLMVKFLRSLIELCSEDLIYVKALYYTLPLAYVSATKLQSSFQGEVNQTAAKKALVSMTNWIFPYFVVAKIATIP